MKKSKGNPTISIRVSRDFKGTLAWDADLTGVNLAGYVRALLVLAQKRIPQADVEEALGLPVSQFKLPLGEKKGGNHARRTG